MHYVSIYLIVTCILQNEKFKIQQTLERLNSENENEEKNEIVVKIASSTETTKQYYTEDRHALEQFPLAVPAASENELAQQSLEECKTAPSNVSKERAESIYEPSKTQRDEQILETFSDTVTKIINEIPSKSLNEEFVSDEEKIDHEELSPTLLWDDTEVEIETKETNEEEEYATVTTPSMCSVTTEGWVNVHSSIGQPATIKEEEIETGFIMATLVPVREREVHIQEEWLELY